MKHYLVLMATIVSQSPIVADANPTTHTNTPQIAVAASTTTLPTAEQLENAAQAIVLPPTVSQELRQVNASNEFSNVTTDIAAPVAANSASTPAEAVPAVSLPKTDVAVISENSTTPVQPPTTATLESLPTMAATDAAAAIAQPVPEPDLTQHAFLAFGAVIGLGIFGITLVRLKKRGKLGFGKSERAQMEIISQMTLSPKRKIILVRIRDQEIALASTEQGITMLTEVGTVKPARQSIAATNVETRLVSAPRTETKTRESVSDSVAAAKKSESFLNALKNIKTKAAQQETTSNNQTHNTSNDTQKPTANKASPTMNQTRGAFPKYLANAFQQEGNRKVSGKSVENGDEENLENVTNMIREKLKNIHQAG